MGGEHWMLTKAHVHPLLRLNMLAFAKVPNITSYLLAEQDLGCAWIKKAES